MTFFFGLIHFSKGGKAFIDTLLPRLNPRNVNGGPCMPFELEVSGVFCISYFICWSMRMIIWMHFFRFYALIYKKLWVFISEPVVIYVLIAQWKELSLSTHVSANLLINQRIDVLHYMWKRKKLYENYLYAPHTYTALGKQEIEEQWIREDVAIMLWETYSCLQGSIE